MVDTIEWFASPTELCALLADLRAIWRQPGQQPVRDALTINPGLNMGEWSTIAFKGGSEPGVLSMAWLLEDADGGWYAMCIAANNTESEVNQQRIFGLAMSAAELLAKE